MTPQEQDMIGGLIDRIQKTQLAEKDTDAEQMLQQGLGRNPDALYILAQTVLVQKYALEQAQTQLSQAKAQIEQMQQHPEPKHATSFLGSLLGRNEEPAPPPPPPPQQAYLQGGGPAYPPYAPVGGGYGAAPQYGAPVQYGAAPQYGAPSQYGAPQGMGGGGFMRGALQTAAGVAAGALAFQGVESLMHGFGHEAGYGGSQGLGGFDGGQRPTEEIVNNYYGDDRGGGGGHDVSADERSLGQQEDRDFGSRGGSDTSSNDRDSLYGSDDTGAGDDASFDDSDSSSDDASFDDSGNSCDDGSGGGDDSNFA
ncbi:DUF2076 domain-containing protein [Tunturibacter empetritectus]|uniref:DUF2076 domain-containing protein n=1 Tax=Tunturiibacter lichenicola TaxID=2051959 RepID=A0A7W8N505_9BACT|nr:DUF2076 domain-containing protein [Edaphobacter lichenicola]MBB5345769.1 hypothetical protein [Edaphobacter lichenicola]